MRKKRGQPYPLGATWDGNGVNFALVSEQATRVELCLFDSLHSQQESERISLNKTSENVWCTYLENINPGCLYGYRVYGPYEPLKGNRFNPNKVLVDPYAKSVVRVNHYDDRMFGYPLGGEGGDLVIDKRDNASCAPLSVVVDTAFTWGDDRAPKTPWNRTVIYETHVKGLTALHPKVPEELRGSFAGLACEPVVDHLKSLGVTAVELMPIHQHYEERHLLEKDLTNYWGYNTLAFFAPDIRFFSGTTEDAVREFKMMVRRLHQAGIEVILDVVYNHTAEGNHHGPTLSLRGIDNQVYYRLQKENPRYYEDFTGCGNTINTLHPRVLQLIMDSLRYWVVEMHVDGFRFDLATALTRGAHSVDHKSAFLKIIQQDPVLSQVKLIAEPWDLGEDGYQVGNFPQPWSELNGKYRDTIRQFWKGDEGQIGELAGRITGSSDLYQTNGRRTEASINFITSHDGFTLRDLVSYNSKHNKANKEENRDGTDNNFSWNCGVEGPTASVKIKSLRARQKRNLIATLMLSQGVPMIHGGDELGHSQSGNNNAYCQDNPISWYQWDINREQKRFLNFVRSLAQLRKAHPVLTRTKFLRGKRVKGSRAKDILWISPSGKEMSHSEWNTPFARCLGFQLCGDGVDDEDEQGNRIKGETLLILMNAHHENIPFHLPACKNGSQWEALLDTGQKNLAGPQKWAAGGNPFPLEGRSLAILRLTATGPVKP